MEIKIDVKKIKSLPVALIAEDKRAYITLYQLPNKRWISGFRMFTSKHNAVSCLTGKKKEFAYPKAAIKAQLLTIENELEKRPDIEFISALGHFRKILENRKLFTSFFNKAK